MRVSKHILIGIFAIGMLFVPLSSFSTDLYDVHGNTVFSGDSLFEFWSYGSPSGGYNGNYYANSVNYDRFLRDFGSTLNLYEWINGREYELKLGRFETWFTPLTLHITRFRWGYGGPYYNWGYNNNWYWDWGKWWDQRNVKIRATKGNDEWVGLVAKTGYYTDIYNQDNHFGDSLNQDWSSRVDYDQYFVAMRRRTDVFGMKMGFSFVNQHFTNFKTNDTTQSDFYSQQGPLTGTINDNIPSAIYLRFTDDSPYDVSGNPDWGGAVVYEIRTFVNGEEISSLSVTGSEKGTNVIYYGRYTESKQKLEASGPNDFIIYKFDMAGINATLNRKVNSVKFIITAANDYKIEVGRDDPRGSYSWVGYTNYQTIARAPGNVKDFSNKTIISHSFGNETGTTLLGYDIEGVLPGINVPFKVEVAASKKFYKFPTEKGERTERAAGAYYFNLSKDLYPIVIAGEFYDIDYNYAGAFAVEDNDDRDDKPDVVDDYVPPYREYSGVRSGDFVLFTIDDRFREGLDMNNNRAFDVEENDTRPDYPYREGQKGQIFSAAYRPFSGAKVESIFVNSDEKMSDRRNQTLFGKMKYNFGFPKVGVEFRHEVKHTKDTIQDNLVYDPNVPNLDVRGWGQYDRWTDDLSFRNNLLNDTYVTVNYTLFKHVTVVNRFLYGSDLRYYSDEFREHQNGIAKIFVNKWYPFQGIQALKQWMVSPMYKIDRWNEQSTKDDFKSLIGNWRKDAFALVFNNKLSEKTGIFIGEQVVIYDDLLQDNDSIRYVFETQIQHDDQYWNRPLFVLAGMKFVNQEADKKINREKYEYIYLQVFFKW